MTGFAVLAAYVVVVCLATGMATGQFATGRGWFPGGDEGDPEPQPTPAPEEPK